MIGYTVPGFTILHRPWFGGASGRFFRSLLAGALLLIPEHAYFRQLVTVSQASVVNLEANLGITEEDLLSTLPEARPRVSERHYLELAKPAKKHRAKVKKTKTR